MFVKPLLKSFNARFPLSPQRGSQLFYLALLLGAIGYSAAPALAEGSRTMYPSSAIGNRANLDQRSTTTLVGGKVKARSIFKVYANAGEYITLGSSAVGVGSGDIYVFNPGLVTGTVGLETMPGTPSFKCSTLRTATGNNNLGKITSRTQELAGPDTISDAATGVRGNAFPAGFVPCYYQAPVTGVYDVYFVPPTPSDTSSGNTTADISLASVNNFNLNQDNNVTAWDITVRSSLSSTTDLNGRMFAYYAYLRQGNNSRYAYFSLYPVTLDGFRYKTDLNGLDPNSFTLYGNRSGFLDSDGTTPLYHDVLGSDDFLTTIQGGAIVAPPQFPIFWNPPDSNVIFTLGIPSAPTEPVVSNFSFAGSISSNNSWLGVGGKFTFTANVPNTYEIVISRDGVNFDPTSTTNRVLRGTKNSGVSTVNWDGKDNSGANFPIGSNYPARIVIANGEYHFPLIDAENSLGGPIITLLNPPRGLCINSNCSTAFYDDRGYRLLNGNTVGTVNTILPGSTPPTIAFSGVSGFDSSTNQRKFGNGTATGWGNTKGLDIWTYFPSATVSAPLNILPLTANVLLVKRITAINGDRTKNPNDNTPLNQIVNDTTSSRQLDDDNPGWPTGYLLGAIDGGKVKPGDEIEYTIYFLNAGVVNASKVRICDRITGNQTFQTDKYATGLGMQLLMGPSSGTPINLTNLNDASDRGQYVATSSSPPSNCYLPAFPGGTDKGMTILDLTGTSNPNLSNIPYSVGAGNPSNSYGFWRFTTKVDVSP